MAKSRYGYKHIHFERTGMYPKTSHWTCMSNQGEVVLGTVKWYGQWRQYCFFPSQYINTVFSASCLADVAEFLKIVRELDHDTKEENRANTSYSTV